VARATASMTATLARNDGARTDEMVTFLGRCLGNLCRLNSKSDCRLRFKVTSHVTTLVRQPEHSGRAGRSRDRADGVHLVFFLHITTGPDNVNNVMALALGVLIVLVLMTGSLWRCVDRTCAGACLTAPTSVSSTISTRSSKTSA
jgi:hypothetical protein